MEENVKLKRVKKIVKVFERILKVIQIVLLVAMIIAFVSGVFALVVSNMAESQDDGNGVVVSSVDIGNHKLVIGEFDKDAFEDFTLESDIEPLNRFFEEHTNEYVAAGLEMLFATFTIAVLFVAMMFLRKIFIVILREETPFAQAVIKQMKKSFIVISVCILIFSFTSLIGIMAIFSLWCIYVIFDYGYTLQELADETI